MFVRYEFVKYNGLFLYFKKFQKPPKVGGLTMNEGSERADVTVDRKVGGPPKVGDKSPKVGGPSFLIHYTTFET